MHKVSGSSPAALGAMLALLVFGVVPIAGQADQAQEVLGGLRAALGGAKLTDLKTLTAEGTFRRVMGQMDMNGDLELLIALPDRFQRIEQGSMPTGMPGPRMATTLNGAQGWMAPLGPMPAGMMIRMGDGPGPGGAGGPGGPGGPGTPGQGAMQRMDPTARIRADFRRLALALLPGSAATAGLTFTHGGKAQSPDGQADVLEVKGDDTFLARLFVDEKTRLPLMLTYVDRDPTQMGRMMNVRRGPGDATETDAQRRERLEAERKRIEAQGPPPPPPRVEIAWYLSDHRKVDGILLPHRLTLQVADKPVQEWEIKKFKVNGKIDLEQFNRKSDSSQ